MPFAQLLLEVHHSDKLGNATFTLMEALEDAGVVPFMNEINFAPVLSGERPKVIEYSFLALRQQALHAR